MVSMNNDKEDQTAAAFSLWWDSHDCPKKSQWLQNTVSELDEKTKAMLNLIQGDGDSFAKRAEMYYKRRPELIKMVEDLHKFYSSLAEKYEHQLRSESIQATFPRSLSLSNSFKQVQVLQNCDKLGNVENKKLGAPTSHPEPEPDFETEKSNIDIESLNKVADELILSNINGVEFESYGNNKGDYFQMWNELRSKVSKLIEDNLHQQQELIRRNDEKREVISDLCSEVNRLKDENRALKSSSLPNHNVDMRRSQSHGSRLKELFLRKFT